MREASASLVLITTEDGVEGSGFIINPEGDVITSAHVVGPNDVLTAVFQDGRRLQGNVVGRDEYLDLAYITLLGGRGDFPAVRLGDSDDVSVGMDVIALGFALGSALGESPTVTRGIVSSLRTDDTGAKWIQTDAPINPGNSGGTLVNRAGDVVGVVTARYEWDEGRVVDSVGLALAVDHLEGRLPFLAEGGVSLRPTPTPAPVPKGDLATVSWADLWIYLQQYLDVPDGLAVQVRLSFDIGVYDLAVYVDETAYCNDSPYVSGTWLLLGCADIERKSHSSVTDVWAKIGGHALRCGRHVNSTPAETVLACVWDR